jgi:hypothetical protein
MDSENLLIDENEYRKEGGLAVKAKWAFYSDIETFPAEDTAATAFAAAATATGTFAMAAGKTFKTLEADLEWHGMDTKSQGEMNAISAMSEYNFEVAGHPKHIVGFLNRNVNRPLCLVLTDIAGNRRILGDALLPCKITEFALNGGKKTGDKKSTSFKVYYPGRIPLFFTGTVPE